MKQIYSTPIRVQLDDIIVMTVADGIHLNGGDFARLLSREQARDLASRLLMAANSEGLA